jgi:hypothetical protein
MLNADIKNFEKTFDVWLVARMTDIKNQDGRSNRVKEFFKLCKESERIIYNILDIADKYEHELKIHLADSSHSRTESNKDILDKVHTIVSNLCNISQPDIENIIEKSFIYDSEPYIQILFDKLYKFAEYHSKIIIEVDPLDS